MNKTTTKPKPMTEEERKQQVVRFLAQKRESYFQLILANILQNPGIDLQTTPLRIYIEIALDGSDYIMKKMYAEAKED